MRTERLKPRPDSRASRIAIESLLVFALCYVVVHLIEAMSGARDFRTKYATFLVLIVSPGIFWGVLYFVTREVRAYRLFLECMFATGLLGFLLPDSNVFGILWLIPVCFGFGAVLALAADRVGKRRRKKWTTLPDLPSLPREAVRKPREPAMPVKEARERLTAKVARRVSSEREASGASRLNPAMEAVRLAVVFGLYVGLHYLCRGVSAISSQYTDLSGAMFIFLYIPVLCGLLIWITGEVGPGQVLLYLVITCFVAGPIDTAIVNRPLAHFVFFFVFGMGFVVTWATGRGVAQRKASLRARRMEDPAIVEAPPTDDPLPEFEEGVEEHEKRRLFKRRSSKKNQSKREHTKWYRHPWFSR